MPTRRGEQEGSGGPLLILPPIPRQVPGAASGYFANPG